MWLRVIFSLNSKIMWQKILITFILFYIFVLLQISFFAYFNLYGTVPNLVFILFFLLVFFEKNGRNYQIIIYAAMAGVFLDIFSYTYLGPSIILLIILGFLLKKAQELLRKGEDDYPFVYFSSLFVIFILAYYILSGMCLYFLDPSKIKFSLGLATFISTAYNLIAASILFFIYKKYFHPENNRQLDLNLPAKN